MSKDLSNRLTANLELINASLKPSLPKKRMLIELSNICNHKCIFCAQKKMTRKRGNINPDFLDRILHEAHEDGVREVGFYMTGEPFMSPLLEAAVKLAKSIGYTYVYITTNGAKALPERILRGGAAS